MEFVTFGDIHPIWMLAGGAAAGVVLGAIIQLFRRKR